MTNFLLLLERCGQPPEHILRIWCYGEDQLAHSVLCTSKDVPLWNMEVDLVLCNNKIESSPMVGNLMYVSHLKPSIFAFKFKTQSVDHTIDTPIKVR